VKGESGTNGGGTAFTGSSNIPWLAAATFVLLLVGSLALRIGSRKATVEDPER
jgi:hypothetical protein